MAVPHVNDDHPNQRWGAEVAFDDLDSVVGDRNRLNQYRQRIEAAGRAAAARLRSTREDR